MYHGIRIRKSEKLKIHPFALLLPPGDDDETMLEDIRRHGIKVPIVLFENQILDGRRRYLIGKKLGIEIPVTHFHGTAKNALELVASFNIYRRHLNASQIAMLAADFAERLSKLDDIPMRAALDIAIEQTRAAPSTAARAKRILETDKATAKAIRNGHTKVGTVLKEDRAESIRQQAIEAIRLVNAKAAVAIESGHLTAPLHCWAYISAHPNDVATIIGNLRAGRPWRARLVQHLGIKCPKCGHEW